MHRPLAVRPVLSLPSRLRADTTAAGVGVTIAMIDSDFVQHPDLMQPAVRIARYVDATTGTDAPLPPTTPLARHWHGTMTACTAAGNGYLSRGRFTSLAPEARVVLVRTMHENGRIPTSTIVRALQWVRDHATEHGIRVVNLSVYADEIDQSIEHPVNALIEEIVDAGIVVVAAAGNNPLAPIRPPASAPSALTVGGLDDKNTLRADDEELYHSSFGRTILGVQKPEVIAPAIWLPAPILPDTPLQREASALCAMDAMDDTMLLDIAPKLMPSTKLPVSMWTSRDVDAIRSSLRERIDAELIATAYYKMVDGTSFAAPIVASIVAQMLSVDPDLTPADVKHILMDTARPLADQPIERQGAGVIRQAEALSVVRGAQDVENARATAGRGTATR